jgi:hypothetical protein
MSPILALFATAGDGLAFAAAGARAKPAGLIAAALPR